MITVCIPTLNRYDLIRECIDSALKGTMPPDKFLIVDNGGKLSLDHPLVEIYKPKENMGVACSWNWLIAHSSEHRVIVNDDIVFCPKTIEGMVTKLNEGNGLVFTCKPYGMLNGFSCYAISDAFFSKIGPFDEGISPNYAYYEDNDYMRRIFLAGEKTVESDEEAIHKHSQTLAAFNEEQMANHHRRFAKAQYNYVKKWGGLPLQEKFTVPYGGVL